MARSPYRRPGPAFRLRRNDPTPGVDMRRDQGGGDAMQPARPTAPDTGPRLGEKVGDGIGDCGFNLYWANISAFLLIFYTDVMGLAAAAVGTMMLITKIVDAITDPLMGALADRTRS